jgi:hypothetical protein
MSLEQVRIEDPRADGVRALRQFIPLPGGDAEAREERCLLRRIDIKDAVRRP